MHPSSWSSDWMLPMWSCLVSMFLCHLSMVIWVVVEDQQLEVVEVAEVVEVILTMSTRTKTMSRYIWKVVQGSSQSRAEVSANVEESLLNASLRSCLLLSPTMGEPRQPMKKLWRALRVRGGRRPSLQKSSP